MGSSQHPAETAGVVEAVIWSSLRSLLSVDELAGSLSHCRHFCIMRETPVSPDGNGSPSSYSQGHSVFTLGLVCCSRPSLSQSEGPSLTLDTGFQMTPETNMLESEVGHGGWGSWQSHSHSQLLEQLEQAGHINLPIPCTLRSSNPGSLAPVSRCQLLAEPLPQSPMLTGCMYVLRITPGSEAVS